MNIYGDIELLEIKSSDSHYMSSAIEEYNKNGNFLSSKYFSNTMCRRRCN